MHNIWKTWGVSVIGSHHKKEGIANQDAWNSQVFKNGSALAVSDGLGSKPYSDVGSKAACLSVIQAACIFNQHDECNYKYLSQLIHALWVLKTGKLKPNDCAATCLFAFQKNEKIILGRLGDGMAIAAGKNKCVVLEDTKKDSFSNITDCLDDSYNAGKWEVRMIPAEDIEVVILCTDGVANGVNTEKVQEFALDLFECYKTMERKKRLREIADWLNKWPISDDKTLACMYKSQAGLINGMFQIIKHLPVRKRTV